MKLLKRLLSWHLSPFIKISVHMLCPVLKICKQQKYEPPRKPQNECVPSEDSDQPGHLPSLIRVFTVRSESSLCAQWVAKDPSFHADCEDSDQTGPMPRLI